MTTTKPAGQGQQAQPGRDGGRRRRPGGARASRGEPLSLDHDAPTGPVSGVLALLLGALELVAALSSWLGPSDG